MFNILMEWAGVKVIQFIIGVVPGNDYDQFSDIFKVGDQVLNIFAWVNKFIPTGLILILLGLTSTLLISKMVIKMIFRFLNKLS